MQSIRNIFKAGVGPSSSHSMGPRRAAEIFAEKVAKPDHKIVVELYGSLAATGKGHLTDEAVIRGAEPYSVDIVWKPEEFLPDHPNGLIFRALDADGKEYASWTVFSVGGGDLEDEKGSVGAGGFISYPDDAIDEILNWCAENKCHFWEYITEFEGNDIWKFLSKIWRIMYEAIERGLNSPQSCLPGDLQLEKKAGGMLNFAHQRVGILRDLNLLSAYALAVSEENASGNMIVTAPTCGSCGVLPSVLYYFYKHNNIEQKKILQAMATAGLIGASVATRASISGAEVGCQGEIGTACAMAAAAAAQIMGGDVYQVEYAAEMALEHSLGLTCDPILGLVQIPCIERNAFAAMRAFECAAYAISTNGKHIVSFDEVVDVMDRTGRDMQDKYRETATGGLAAIMRKHLREGI